jgi:hypothetical protein
MKTDTTEKGLEAHITQHLLGKTANLTQLPVHKNKTKKIVSDNF